MDEEFLELKKTYGCYTAKKIIKQRRMKEHLAALRMDFSVNSNLIKLLELMLDDEG